MHRRKSLFRISRRFVKDQLPHTWESSRKVSAHGISEDTRRPQCLSLPPLGPPHCLPMVLEPHFRSAQGHQSLPQQCCRSVSLQPCLPEGPRSYVTGSAVPRKPDVLAGCPGWTLDSRPLSLPHLL